MQRFHFFPKTEAQKYALAGAIFGFLFPVIATLIRVANFNLPFGFSSIVMVQATDPLLWIIDTAPIILGSFAFFAGQRQDHLKKLNSELKQREKELENIQQNLKKSIEERTQELVIANQQTNRQAEQLRLIADVARSAISMQEVDRLLAHITKLINERFNFYHVGIFLLDEQKQYAILRASTSQGGLRMLEKGYLLRIGAQGIVGYVTQTGEARIASNVDDNPVYFGSYDLPETRSEIVLPLKSGDVILGALDIHSTQANVFSEDDVATLSTLADQIAIAIQNAISYEQSKRALLEAQLISRQVSSQSWRVYAETLQRRGYRYDGVRSEALKEASISAEASNVMSIPLRLRGQTLGHLMLKHSDHSHGWTEDELAMAEATAERVALALEGARLLQDAQKRAARETFLSDISAKLGASFQMDSILRDTVEELGQTLKHSTITFQLVNPSDIHGAEGSKHNGNTVHEEKSE